MCERYRTREREREQAKVEFIKIRIGWIAEAKDKEMASDIKVRVYHTDIFKARCEDEKMEVENTSELCVAGQTPRVRREI